MPWIAKIRGTSPIHATHPRLHGGKAETRKTPDKRLAEIGNSKLKILDFNTSITPYKNCGIADSAKRLHRRREKEDRRQEAEDKMRFYLTIKT